MNLEERYKSAPESTYVGRVRDRQEESAGAIQGVNFMDGVPRTQPGPDTVQREFTRNAGGDFKYNGGGKVPGTPGLSRWLTPGLEKGDDYFTNNKFTTILAGDTRNAPGTLVHKYSPLSGKKFQEASILSALAKTKILGAASGPTP
jgi:hypothetical protein